MVKILVSMPDEFLAVIDNCAENEQRTRSELVREALRNYFRKNIIINSEIIDKKTKIVEELLR